MVHKIGMHVHSLSKYIHVDSLRLVTPPFDSLMPLKFKTSYWGYEDDQENNRLIIYVAGLTVDNESVFLRIIDYKPHVYLELSDKIDWDKTKCQKLYNYIGGWGSQGKGKLHGPLYYELCKRRSLYGSRVMYTMKLHFNTYMATKFISRTFSRDFYLAGVGTIVKDSCKVH